MKIPISLDVELGKQAWTGPPMRAMSKSHANRYSRRRDMDRRLFLRDAAWKDGHFEGRDADRRLRLMDATA